MEFFVVVAKTTFGNCEFQQVRVFDTAEKARAYVKKIRELLWKAQVSIETLNRE